MRGDAPRSFGRPVEPEPEPDLPPPVVFPPIQLPVQFVVDPRSLEVLAAQVAGAIGQAIYDGIAAGIDPEGDDIPPGPRPNPIGLDQNVDPASAQLAGL